MIDPIEHHQIATLYGHTKATLFHEVVKLIGIAEADGFLPLTDAWVLLHYLLEDQPFGPPLELMP